MVATAEEKPQRRPVYDDDNEDGHDTTTERLLVKAQVWHNDAAATASPTPAIISSRDAFYDGVPDIDRVFALDYDVLYKDYVRGTIIPLTCWGLIGALHLYRVVAYYFEDRAMESATSYMGLFDDELPHHTMMDHVEAVLRCFVAAGSLFLFVFWAGNSSQRWRITAGRHLALTTTGVRMDFAYTYPSGNPMTFHVSPFYPFSTFIHSLFVVVIIA
jgi:hypothetical protein